MTFTSNSYSLYLTDGTLLTNSTSTDGKIYDVSIFGDNADSTSNRFDSTYSSLKLVRRGAKNYSDIVSENLIHMLENFADASEPENPIRGQLWFDTSVNSLKVYNNGNFQNVSSDAGIGGTVNINYTGDISGNISFSGAGTYNSNLSLGATGVTAGTYTSATITVDTKGRITFATNGASQGITQTDITNALGYLPLKRSDVFDNNGNVLQNGNVLVPRGIITMWYGDTTNVPSGWALCDGSNGTPNMRDKFVIGAGNAYSSNVSYGSSSISGSTSSESVSITGINITINPAGSHSHGGATYPHTLTEAQMPAHQHATAWGEAGGRGYFGKYGNTGTTNNPGSNGGIDYDNLEYLTSSKGGGEAHSHSIEADGTHTHTVSGGGTATGGAHSHTFSANIPIPPCIALCYIMKL